MKALIQYLVASPTGQPIWIRLTTSRILGEHLHYAVTIREAPEAHYAKSNERVTFDAQLRYIICKIHTITCQKTKNTQ